MWKQIRNYPYEINKKGVIRNIKTKHIKKSYIKKDGYEHIQLYPIPSNRVNFLVHRLLAEAFLPNPDNFPCVNHKDTVRTNNYLNNLEWCSYSHNNKHAYKKGKACRKGSKNPFSKLNESKVREIRKSNKTNKELSIIYKVSPNTISEVRRNISWKHVK